MNFHKLTTAGSLVLCAFGVWLGGCQKVWLGGLQKKEEAAGYPIVQPESAPEEHAHEHPDRIIMAEPAQLPEPTPPRIIEALSAKPKPPAVYTLSAPLDWSTLVADEFKKLTLGQILFNPHDEMQAGVKERIEVRIAKGVNEDLSKGLHGAGVPIIASIKVGTFMKVRLMGDNFDIDTLSHEEQLVAGDGFTEWDWDVTPLQSGVQELLLVVTVRIKLADLGEEKKDLPVFSREIKVKINPIYTIKIFSTTNWQWLISTILGSGMIGWIYKKVKAKQRRAMNNHALV